MFRTWFAAFVPAMSESVIVPTVICPFGPQAKAGTEARTKRSKSAASDLLSMVFSPKIGRKDSSTD
jgi:hypothetical protein